MANDATQVRVASNGRLMIAAVGTAAPVTTVATYAVGWTDLGFATDDGVTLTPSTETDDINAWQSAVPVRKIVTGSTLEIGFTLVQTNIATLKLFFNATESGGNLEIPVAPEPLERALSVEWVDGAVIHRLVVPRAQLTDTGDVTLARGDAVGYEMTFSALAPATGALATLLLPAA